MRAISDERGTADYWAGRIQERERRALAEDELREAERRIRENTGSLVDLSSYPGTVPGDALQEMILASQQDFRGEKNHAGHYDADGSPISPHDFLDAQENCNLTSIGIGNACAQATVRYALTTERTNLRLLPTRQNYFDTRDFRHYDDLQGTALDPAEPLAVLHESRDGEFVFAQARHYAGWVPIGSVAFTKRPAWEKYICPKEFLVVTEHRKVIQVDGGGKLLFQMGAILPLCGPKRGSDGKWRVWVPVREGGAVHEAEAHIADDGSVHKGWLPCAQENFIRQAFRFLGDPYGWGGMEDSVDCSSFVGDVYRSMGIELPRDADQQETAMPLSVQLSGLSGEERREAMEEIPAGALLFLPGHVMMYLGKDEKGTPIAIHSASSFYVFSGGRSEKQYIRRVLVSDLHFRNRKGAEALDALTSIGFLKRGGT